MDAGEVFFGTGWPRRGLRNQRLADLARPARVTLRIGRPLHLVNVAEAEGAPR